MAVQFLTEGLEPGLVYHKKKDSIWAANGVWFGVGLSVKQIPFVHDIGSFFKGFRYVQPGLVVQCLQFLVFEHGIVPKFGGNGFVPVFDNEDPVFPNKRFGTFSFRQAKGLSYGYRIDTYTGERV